MNKIKVMTVFGTRPEAVKMCPLVNELKKYEEIESEVCVTAQHRQMLDQVLKLFDITPEYDLDIMKQRQTLTGITVRALEGLETVLDQSKPDLVLVHGDTSTTFVASLAAYYHQIKVGHVEAGLRTYNKYFPFPEEMNRKLTGQIADLHFSPTKSNYNNLIREGISPDDIFITGNTVIDALSTTVKEDYTFISPEVNKIDFQNKRVIVMTAHRRENLGEPLQNICRAVKRIAEEFSDVQIVYPVHLNPAVRETAEAVLGHLPNVLLCQPLDVEDLHNAMSRCFFVLTDSGGLQEEAPSLGCPVLVLRNETERPEAVEAGTVKIAGTNEETIYSMTRELLTDTNAYNAMAKAVNPYGDGKASMRTVEAILYKFGFRSQRPADFQGK